METRPLNIRIFLVTGNKKVDEASEAMARCFQVDYIFPMVEHRQEPQRNAKGTSYSRESRARSIMKHPFVAYRSLCEADTRKGRETSREKPYG